MKPWTSEHLEFGRLPQRLQRLIVVVVIVAGLAVLVALTRDVRMSGGEIVFWIVVTLMASAFPVQLPRGPAVSVSIMPIVAAAILGGALPAVLVAALGTTELRELRGRVPWYGVLYNHAAAVIPALVAALTYHQLVGVTFHADAQSLFGVISAAASYFVINAGLSALAVGYRDHRPPLQLMIFDSRVFGASLIGLASLSWLMAIAYPILGILAILPFALPLYIARASHHMVAEATEMFTQTIQGLATAIDARDPSTKHHSARVSEIAVSIGAALGCSDEELEQLEWGGLLHDVGKIGISDDILLKEGALTRDERMHMNAHPVTGEEIIRPVGRLEYVRPLIRHHHEWFNGSGYPARLVGLEIPRLVRIVQVADAFEAMTAIRPYQKHPRSPREALTELRRFSGIQFDPEVVEAFATTHWVTQS